MAGFHLLASVIVEGVSLSVLRERGVSARDFKEEEIDVLRYIKSHYLSFGKYPSAKVVRREAGYQLPVVTEPFDYYLDRLQKRTRFSVLRNTAKQVLSFLDESQFEEAESLLLRTGARLRTLSVSQNLQTFAKLAEKLIEDHGKVEMGARFGFDFLDDITYGAQKGDFVAIAGRPEAGKTYFLLHALKSAHKQGFKCMLVTTEMTAMQCARRLLSMIGAQHFDDFRKGRLSPWAMERLKMIVAYGKAEGEKKLRWRRNTEIIILDSQLTGRVEDVDLMVTELKPDVLYIDGAYSLLTEQKAEIRSTSDRVSYITHYLKQIALTKKIPVIATYQFSKKGVGLDNIFQSDVVSQLASLLFGIDKGKETKTFKPRKYRTLHIVKGREGEEGRIRVSFSKNTTELKEDRIFDTEGVR